jgi:Domain of unknown function (DUF202)
MIRDYRDHAANERTLLAWVRTGIAVIALGFLIEKFNLFVLTIAIGSLTRNAACNSKGYRDRLAVMTGSPSSSSGLRWLCSEPCALSVPAGCSMIIEHISSARFAQSCSSRWRWR